jgi:TM2 domain-containing membrane protein YozV
LYTADILRQADDMAQKFEPGKIEKQSWIFVAAIAAVFGLWMGSIGAGIFMFLLLALLTTLICPIIDGLIGVLMSLGRIEQQVEQQRERLDRVEKQLMSLGDIEQQVESLARMEQRLESLSRVEQLIEQGNTMLELNNTTQTFTMERSPRSIWQNPR